MSIQSPRGAEPIKCDATRVRAGLARGRWGDAPRRMLGQGGLLLCVGPRWRGELAAGGDAELAVDVARVRADGLDTDLQGDATLRVRAALLEQREHFSLARGQGACRHRTSAAVGPLPAESAEVPARRGGSH